MGWMRWLFDRCVRASRFSGNADEEALVHEAVGNGGGGGGIVKEGTPVLEGQIGGDDG